MSSELEPVPAARLVAVGDPDSPIPVARLHVKVNPVDGVPLLDPLTENPGGVYDILLTGCKIEAAGMHLDRAEPGYSYVSVVATATGVALVPKD